jgi:hypothetical protein
VRQYYGLKLGGGTDDLVARLVEHFGADPGSDPAPAAGPAAGEDPTNGVLRARTPAELSGFSVKAGLSNTW